MFKKFVGYAPASHLMIPPPLNPDIKAMRDAVRTCYTDLIETIEAFQDEAATLTDAGTLDPNELQGLLENYGDLRAAIDDAILEDENGYTGAHLDDCPRSGQCNHCADHRLADHAKHVYAIGARDIAALQYRLAELAHTGRVDFAVHKRLQWEHCLPIWQTLYSNTTSAVRDYRVWDGWNDWYDNTYSDGRQVMVQARLKNWEDLERDRPYKAGVCGDGPIQEHPWASICRIHPVVKAHANPAHCHQPIEIDLADLVEKFGLAKPTGGTSKGCQCE